MLAGRMAAVMQPHCKADGRAAHEPRPEGDRVVVLFTRTGVCRLFDKLDTVGNWYSADTYERHVYVTPRQMALKLTDGTMIRCLGWLDTRAMDRARSSALKGMDLATLLWQTCQRWGKHVTREFPQETSRESDSKKFIVDLSRLSSDEGKALLAKKPRQCQVVADAIWQCQQSVLTDDEMDSLARRTLTSGKLKTKQDPCRIFRYYLPTLAELKMVEYRTRKVKDELEEGEYEGSPGYDDGEDD